MKTDRSGRYVFTAVPVGTYGIHVEEAEGNQTLGVSSVNSPPATLQMGRYKPFWTQVTVSDDGIAYCDVSLQEQPPPPAVPGVVQGIVRDEADRPIGNAHVFLLPFSQITLTDARGCYAFTDVEPGEHDVVPQTPGCQSVLVPVNVVSGGNSIVKVNLARHGVVDKNPGARKWEMYGPDAFIPARPPAPGTGRTAWRATQEDTLREAIFRYLFKHAPPDRGRKVDVYYLSLFGFPWGTVIDPSDEFLKRFAGHSPPVRKASSFEDRAEDDRRNEPSWVIYRVTSCRWLSDIDVQVEAGQAQPGYVSSDTVGLNCLFNQDHWEIRFVYSGSA